MTGALVVPTAYTAGQRRVFELWADADLRGWGMVPEVPPGWRWAAHDHLSGLAYRPGDAAVVSRVEAHHRGRTLSLTGVADEIEAVEALRWFLGWPDGWGSHA